VGEDVFCVGVFHHMLQRRIFFLDKAFCRFVCRCVFNLEIMIIVDPLSFFDEKKSFFDMHALPI